jgi:FkbM family methyltransferase
VKKINDNIFSEIINKDLKEIFKSKIKSKNFKLIRKQVLKYSKLIFDDKKKNSILIKNIGLIKLPFFSFGNIKSYHLWDYEDLMLFSYYLNKKNYYDLVYDLGSNIGLHSIILSKIGYKKIISFEPDKKHYERQKKNIKINKCSNIKIFNKAVFNKSGIIKFNRILGNTTSSHIEKLKKNPYGKIETIKVRCVNFLKILKPKNKTLLKIDIEGAEAKILKQTKQINWKDMDAFLEVSDLNSSKIIFQHMKKINVKIFSHKNGWKKVSKLKEMPSSYKEGMIFISLNSF